MLCKQTNGKVTSTDREKLQNLKHLYYRKEVIK